MSPADAAARRRWLAAFSREWAVAVENSHVRGRPQAVYELPGSPLRRRAGHDPHDSRLIALDWDDPCWVDAHGFRLVARTADPLLAGPPA